MVNDGREAGLREGEIRNEEPGASWVVGKTDRYLIW
jgi:hypothetical protein